MSVRCAFGFHDLNVKLNEKADRAMFEYCARCPKTRPYLVYMYI